MPNEQEYENYKLVLLDGRKHLTKMGLVVNQNDIRGELNKLGIQYNHGKPRKVSIKRASPQLSRGQLRIFQALATLRAVIKKG